MFSALESGKVRHALFDTYAIGSEKALFEGADNLHIYEIYAYSSTYGIVIGGETAVLQKCFNMFKRKNIEDIFRNIKDNIDSIEVSGKSNPLLFACDKAGMSYSQLRIDQRNI